MEDFKSCTRDMSGSVKEGLYKTSGNLLSDDSLYNILIKSMVILKTLKKRISIG